MSWVGRECKILASAVAPELSGLKGRPSGEDELPVSSEDEPVRLVKMEFIPDDDLNGEEEKK